MRLRRGPGRELLRASLVTGLRASRSRTRPKSPTDACRWATARSAGTTDGGPSRPYLTEGRRRRRARPRPTVDRRRRAEADPGRDGPGQARPGRAMPGRARPGQVARREPPSGPGRSPVASGGGQGTGRGEGPGRYRPGCAGEAARAALVRCRRGPAAPPGDETGPRQDGDRSPSSTCPPPHGRRARAVREPPSRPPSPRGRRAPVRCPRGTDCPTGRAVGGGRVRCRRSRPGVG